MMKKNRQKDMNHPQNESRSYHASIVRSDRGYTLLFAMIVASIVLALGVSLLTISRKEFVLSSSAVNSSDAFYAADSGMGCAEFWDNNYAFSTSSPTPLINCSINGSDSLVSSNVSMGPGSCATGACIFTFYAAFLTEGATNQSCAAVDVVKYYAFDPNLGNAYHLYTQITSAGYNIGYNPASSTPDCSIVSPKKVNRTLETLY